MPYDDDMVRDLTLWQCQCLEYGLERLDLPGASESVSAWYIEYRHERIISGRVIDSLLARGLLEPMYPDFKAFKDKVKLSEQGEEVARAMRRNRAETWRMPAVARTTVLRALYQVATAPEKQPYDRHPSDLRRVKPRRDRSGNTGVLLSDLHDLGRLHVYGKQLTTAEIERIAERLESNGLLETRRENSARRWSYLTTEGMDCAESGEPVDEYLQKQHKSAASTFITHVSGSHGVIIGQQENVTQINNQGFDPSKLIEFAGLVRQISPTLVLATEQETALAEQAEELETEATAGRPDRGRLRQLASAVLNGLTSAAPTVASTMAIRLGEEALKALGD